MIELTIEKTLKLLGEAIEEKGEDYVYINEHGICVKDDNSVQCQYVHLETEPGCGVGNVLMRAGISAEYLTTWEGSSADFVLQSLRSDNLLTYDQKSEKVLNTFQKKQDQGATWGEALAYARHVYGV